MLKLKYAVIILVLLVGACKLDSEQPTPIPSEEQWQFVLTDITEPILDIKVNGDELHLISNENFYRIKGDEVLEKRTLITNPSFDNTTVPKIGNTVFYRILIENNETFLEFQTTNPGGTPIQINIADFSQGGSVFPNQVSGTFNQPNVTVAFDQNDDFIFTGFEETNGMLQAFCGRVEIELNAAMNQIDQLEITERFDLEPNSVSGPVGLNNISVVEDVFFMNFGTTGGTFRLEGNQLDFDENSAIFSVLKETDGYIATERRNIVESSNKGLTWTETADALDLGLLLRKEGAFYLEESLANNQLFKFGKSIEDLELFTLPFWNSVNAPSARISYFEDQYYLFMFLDGAPSILKRSTLD